LERRAYKITVKTTMVAARRRLTASGYCRKDAYESLALSFANGDVERCCCLAAELACTPGEPGTLIGTLIDTYAQWHLSGSLAVVARLAHAFADMDGQPSVMRSFASNAVMRRSLCDAVIIPASLPRRACSELWKTKQPSSPLPPFEEGDSEAGVNAVRIMVQEGNGRGAVSIAAVLLSWRGKDMPPPSGDLPVRKPHDRDVVWHLWNVASETAATMSESVQLFVRASLRMYSQRFTLQRRAARANLLCYALLTCARGRVASSSPLDEHIEVLLKAAHDKIDEVFDDILSRPPEEPPGHQEVGDGNGEVDGDEKDEDEDNNRPVDYMRCYTRFDNQLRCRLADERRHPDEAPCNIKHVTVVSKHKA
jgi:hypothetical protein